MARNKALRKRDLRQVGWKALVAELGIANTTRFVMGPLVAEQDYAKLRAELFTKKSLEDFYAKIRHIPGPREH